MAQSNLAVVAELPRAALSRYDAARSALAEAHRVDEVKDIRDKAVALEAYAKQAKDTSLIKHATDIRLRAERKAGELLAKNPKAKGARGNPGGQGAPIVRSQVATAQDQTLAEMGVTKTQSAKWQKLAALSEEKFEEKVEQAQSRAENATTSAPRNPRSEFTGNNQWFTPEAYLTMAREVLGEIDLDPATHEIAQQSVKASNFYTEADNSLTKEWHGRIWLNPPYAQPEIGHFADKMVEEASSGRVEQAIMLTHNYTDTAWFQKLARAASSICFTRGRIRFVSPTGEIAAPTQGQAFFYFGANIDSFKKVFSEIGFVVEVMK